MNAGNQFLLDGNKVPLIRLGNSTVPHTDEVSTLFPAGVQKTTRVFVYVCFRSGS